MYPPSSRSRGGLQVGNGGQVLDLETAVKDGILGGGKGGGLVVIHGVETKERSHLEKMIDALVSIDVPSVFICPISLEPMQDPVTLCTGQTYERANILKWFSMGHLTCPTTMQGLWDHTVTPNATLYQLIYSWFSQKYLDTKKRSEDVQGRALELLETLKKVKGQARVRTLKELRQLVIAHGSANKTVVDHGGVNLISSLLGPFTTHAVGSESIALLVNLDLKSSAKMDLLQPSKISLVVDVLNEGSIDTKINCTKLIQRLTEQEDFDSETVSSLSLLVGLLRLVKDKRHPDGLSAGLRLLKLICTHETVRCSVVSVGVVPLLVDLLPHLNSECLEMALHILESISSVPEGLSALKNCRSTIPNIVKLLMKVSESCTQYALSILWAVCELCPEECASLAVDAGVAAKLLLVIQSGCSPVLKQRSAELLKLCSLNYTTTIFINKCKLTRTIQ